MKTTVEYTPEQIALWTQLQAARADFRSTPSSSLRYEPKLKVVNDLHAQWTKLGLYPPF